MSHHDVARPVKFAVYAAFLMAFFASTAAAETPGYAKAQTLVGDHKTVIARFMHPTSRLEKIVCTKTNCAETGEFCLVYAFWFDAEKYNSSLRFKFYEDGSLDTLEVAGTTTWIKPFQAGDLLLKVVWHFVPAPTANRLAWMRTDGFTKMMLELWLRAQQKP
jgi:hypothetical protein